MVGLLAVKDNVSKYDRKHITRSDHPFDKTLAAAIAAPPEGSVVMEITPSMAADMLKRNTKNRAFRAPWASELARRMKTGRWIDTGVPIVFGKSGNLLDGQHRLHGVSESETTCQMHVIFGVPDEAFAHIDVGRKRTAGDIFHINNVENANLMAAATNVVYGYDSGYTRSAVNRITLSEAELYTAFLGYPELPQSARVGHAFASCHLASPSIATALHYICARKCRRDADVFFDKVATGAGLISKRDPALVLRNSLIRAISSDEKLGRIRLMAITLKAWNATRDNRPISQLRMTDDEALPRAR